MRGGVQIHEGALGLAAIAGVGVPVRLDAGSERASGSATAGLATLVGCAPGSALDLGRKQADKGWQIPSWLKWVGLALGGGALAARADDLQAAWAH